MTGQHTCALPAVGQQTTAPAVRAGGQQIRCGPATGRQQSIAADVGVGGQHKGGQQTTAPVAVTQQTMAGAAGVGGQQIGAGQNDDCV
jgi:hypothetical protein